MKGKKTEWTKEELKSEILLRMSFLDDSNEEYKNIDIFKDFENIEDEEYRTGGIIEEEMVYFIERTKYAIPETPVDKRQYTIVGFENNAPVKTLKEWGLWASKNHKIVVIQKRKDVVTKEEMELQKAEAQLLGFYHCKGGVSIAELVSSMALTKEEWKKLQEEYGLEYLTEEDKTDIQSEVNK